MTIPKKAPSKSVRYRWTREDAGLVLQKAPSPPLPGQKPPPPPSVTPYGIDPKQKGLVLDLGTATQKTLSQLKAGDAIEVPLDYSNSWFPHRAARFFDPDYGWERLPSGIQGKTIGELCKALFKSNNARYPHYDFSHTSRPEEGWNIFDYWEHTDHRWCFLESGKFARNMDPLTIPTEVADSADPAKLHRISWVRYSQPRERIVVVAPTPKGAPAAPSQPNKVVGQPTLDKDSWRFKLVNDFILAVSVGQAKYADLADGSLGKGMTAKPWDTVDLTPWFPAWVKQVLTAQVKTGYVPVQPDPRENPEGYAPGQYEFGYGNCHGFTSKLLQLFDTEAFSLWQFDDENATTKKTSVPPPGAPTRVQDLDPRYQCVNSIYEDALLDTPMRCWAYSDKFPMAGGPKWASVIDIGKNLQVQKILSVAAAVDIPRFGDLGLAIKFPHTPKDHSVIALGLAGGDPTRLYALSKKSPLTPYGIIAEKIASYKWYRPTKSTAKKLLGGQ